MKETVEYSEELKIAAEQYLINCFKDKNLGSHAHETLITSALVVVEGVSILQTTMGATEIENTITTAINETLTTLLIPQVEPETELEEGE